MVHLLVEIRGPIDSEALWSELETYGVNVTDMSERILVHGEVESYLTAVVITGICSKYGDSKASIERR